jgi:multicomponent Na+:H+ antiporter subunit D
MAAFVICGLSLIGVPLTAGFISKWYLVLAALEKGWWPVAVLIVATSLLALVYIWRVIEVAYFKPEPQRPGGAAAIREAPLILLIPTWVVTVANVYFGIDTHASVGIAGAIAKQLTGAGS